MNTKVKTWVGTVIIIIIAITVGAFVWVYEKNQPEIAPAQTVKISPVKKLEAVAQPVDDVLSWQTYRNEKYGFEFQYPSSYKFSENNLGINQDIIFENDSNKFIVRVDKNINKANGQRNECNDKIYHGLEPFETVKLGEMNANKFVQGSYNTPQLIAVVLCEKNIKYIFEFNQMIGLYENNQILSTFKFIN